MMKKILTCGEPMGLFIADEEAPLEDVRHFTTSVAGAEFNVAVGLTRLGHKVGYITKLGVDPFGKQVINMMNDNHIDTSLTVTSNDSHTGFMLKSKTKQGDPDIYYYRKNSAASTISVDDIKGMKLDGWDAIHTTGILSATSDSAHEASLYLMKAAKKAGIPIFFDPNLRPQLWKDQQTMVKAINEMAQIADYVMPGENEGLILCGSKDPDVIADYYLSRGVKCVIVKVGSHGAYGYKADEKAYAASYKHGPIVDTVGAGDGFACGLESGILEGLSLEESLKRGNAIGAIQIMNPSDNEGLPTREELDRFMKETQQDNS